MRGLVAAIVVCLIALTTTDPAAAQWSGTTALFNAPSQSQTLAPPTSLSASTGCVLVVLIPRVTLTWTASTSTFTASYDILRSTVSGGPYTQVGSAAGAATTTFTDSASLGLNITYFYVVRARLTNWVSTSTAQVSAKTPVVCL